jgi:hypothetical protein
MRLLTEQEVLALPKGTKVWVQFAKTHEKIEAFFENYYGMYPNVYNYEIGLGDTLTGRIADTENSDLTKIWVD